MQAFLLFSAIFLALLLYHFCLFLSIFRGFLVIKERLNNFDNDGSGGLSQAEIEYVTEINVAGTEEQPGNVADLTGIGYFTALTNLFCEYNQLTSLDISSNTLLTKLWCNNNRLTELDVSHNKNLTDLV